MALDWTLLFELTSQYNGVKVPKQVVVMSYKDSNWLHSQADSVKFDDNDTLKQNIDSLKEESKAMKVRLQHKYGGGPGNELDENEVLQLFNEISELLD